MPVAGVNVSNASAVVDMSNDAKLAVLVVKNEIAPLDTSSFSVSGLMPGAPKNLRDLGFCFASAGTVSYHAGNVWVMMAFVALNCPEEIKMLYHPSWEVVRVGTTTITPVICSIFGCR